MEGAERGVRVLHREALRLKPEIVYEWIRTPGDEELLPVPRTATGGNVCPVCGDVCEEYKEGAWRSNRSVQASNGVDFIGGPSYDICTCCGTQYGLDDMMGSSDGTVQTAWRELRKRWLESEGQSQAAYAQLESISELTGATPFIR
jgi:hypothetical protein